MAGVHTAPGAAASLAQGLITAADTGMADVIFEAMVMASTAAPPMGTTGTVMTIATGCGAGRSTPVAVIGGDVTTSAATNAVF